MQFASRIWRALAGDRHLMVLSVICGLLFTALGVIPPLLIRQMILWLREPESAGAFWVLASLIAIVYVLRGVMRYLYGLSSHIAAYRALHRLSVRVYGHLQKMSPSFLNRHHSGNLVARNACRTGIHTGRVDDAVADTGYRDAPSPGRRPCGARAGAGNSRRGRHEWPADPAIGRTARTDRVPGLG